MGNTDNMSALGGCEICWTGYNISEIQCCFTFQQHSKMSFVCLSVLLVCNAVMPTSRFVYTYEAFVLYLGGSDPHYRTS